MFGKSNRQYHRCLETLYRNLALLDAGDITDRYQFEKIEDNLYSIRSKSVMNPRVLYTYRNERGQYILLLPFLEKSKSDYEEGKRRARQQIKNLGGILYE